MNKAKKKEIHRKKDLYDLGFRYGEEYGEQALEMKFNGGSKRDCPHYSAGVHDGAYSAYKKQQPKKKRAFALIAIFLLSLLFSIAVVAK